MDDVLTKRGWTFNSLSRDHVSGCYKNELRRLGDLSTPSLGITAFTTSAKVLPAPPTFNSLSRDHQNRREGSRRQSEEYFQLPLSGSLRLGVDVQGRSLYDFQLPLSGSLCSRVDYE